MKMIQKKVKSLICAGLGLILCVLLCGGIGMTAQAAKEKTYNGFTYEDHGYGLTIVKEIVNHYQGIFEYLQDKSQLIAKVQLLL